jgi:SCP-2 sterol transfer family
MIHDVWRRSIVVRAMSSWDRPPIGIPIADFFQTWLPSAFQAAGRPAPADAPRVRATLSGAGGGSWDITPEDDRLAIEPPSARLPDVWLRQSVEDFRAAFDGDPNLPVLIPPGWSALDLLFLDPRDTELLRQVSGRALVELAGRRARRWSFDVAFGKAGASSGRPRTTIRLDGDAFEGLQGGTLPPMQALLDGRLSIEGDRTLAMQIVLLLGSRLAGRLGRR